MYQDEVDLPPFQGEPLEYLYQDPEVMVALEIKPRVPEKISSPELTLIQLSWPEELLKSFESDSWYENAGSYLSYNVVRVAKQVRLPQA